MALLLTLLVSCVCFGQQRGATLQGQVIDQLGGVIVDADVTLSRQGFQPATKTNSQGGFSFSGLLPGRYSIRVTAVGFAPYENKVLDITAETRVLSIPLRVSGQAQEVTVMTDLRLSVDVDNSATMLVLRGAAIDALPDGPGGLESALQMLTARAGNPRGPQIVVNGFSDSRIPPKNSIREIRINQNAFSAQYDQPGLGRVEILTKPGTDTVQGGFYSNFNDERFNSRNPFAPERTAFQSRLYGANLGGPVLPKHASFYIDAQRSENDDNAVVNATVLDATFNPIQFNHAILTPRRFTTASSRLDFRLNQSHTLIARYAYLRDNSKNMGIGDFSLPSRAYQSRTLDHTFQITETGIIGQSLINELRLQYVEDQRRQDAESNVAVLRVPQAFIGGGSEIGRSSERRALLDLENNMIWATGNHAFKAGFRGHRIFLTNVSPQNFAGTYTFAGRLAPQLTAASNVVYDNDGRAVLIPITTLESYRRTLFFQDQGLSPAAIRDLGGGAAQFSVAAGEAGEAVHQYDMSAYLQDDWRIVPNLTISGGFRSEAQNNIHRRVDFAPRVGIAWSPSTSQDAKLVIRAGTGFFYDRVSENLVLQSRRFNGVTQRQYVVSDPAVLDRFPETPAVETLGSFLTPPTITRLSSEIRAPYLMQTNLGLERSLPRSISVSANYIHSRSVHTLRSRNVNAPVPGSTARPQPGIGEIMQYEASGNGKQNQLVFNLTQRLGHRLSYYGTYIFTRAFSDTDAPGSFPASSYDLAAEWSRSLQDIRHTFYWGGWITGPFKLEITPTIIVRSGAPFNITTGLDSNNDTVYAERPSFATANSGDDVVITNYGRFDLSPAAGQMIPRNSGRGPRFFTTHLKLARTFNMTPTSNSPAPAKHNVTMTMAVQIQNLINHTNPDVPAGNLSSPQFGRSYSSVGDFGFGNNAGGNRRIEAQIYFGF